MGVGRVLNGVVKAGVVWRVMYAFDAVSLTRRLTFFASPASDGGDAASRNFSGRCACSLYLSLSLAHGFFLFVGNDAQNGWETAGDDAGGKSK